MIFWVRLCAWHRRFYELVIQYPNIKIETTFMSSDDIKANTKIAASSNTLPDMWYNWGGVLADFLGAVVCMAQAVL